MNEIQKLNEVLNLLGKHDKKINVMFNCGNVMHNVTTEQLIDMAKLSEIAITFHINFNCNDC